MNKINQYTRDLYSRYQFAIDELNKTFFSGFNGREKLPPVCLAINKDCHACCVAYVDPVGLHDTSINRKVHYLALNPKYLNRTYSEILSTLYHELCHVYEVEYIHIPRGGYHTKAWDALMREAGLTPVYMNPSRTAVSHTVDENGLFDAFVKTFEKNNENFFTLQSGKLPIVSEPTEPTAPAEPTEPTAPKADNYNKVPKKYNRNKIKYFCGCSTVWGKAGLKIKCCECGNMFEAK